MKISNTVIKAITAHAKREMPHEACGYLVGDDTLVHHHYEMTNTDKAADHFSMDPKEQFAAVKDMREQGTKLVAVYHSHPETPSRPSEEDIRLAYDPNISHVIISLVDPENITIKSFKICKGNVSLEEIEIVEG